MRVQFTLRESLGMRLLQYVSTEMGGFQIGQFNSTNQGQYLALVLRNDWTMFYNAFLDILYTAFFLLTPRLTSREFNSYGSRRGNDAVMSRGTFANIRLVNKFMNKAGPKTIHLPSGECFHDGDQ